MQRSLINRLQGIEGVRASVSMGSLQPVQVFVIGEVQKPGQYTVSALANPTDALFAAGGVSKRGSLRNIQLLRNGTRLSTLDFYDFLLDGDNFGTWRLQSGDVLMVPVVERMAAIAGNVRRSALYEINEKTDLKDLVALAGGFTPSAWTNTIQIERFKRNEHQVVLDLQVDSLHSAPDFPIQDGDVVKIYPIKIRDMNAVYLEGNVLRPGKYEYRAGMSVSDLLGGYEQLLAETYFEYAVIRRRVLPTFDEHIFSFNLRKALDNQDSPDNMTLEPRDIVTIYNQDFFEPDRSVMMQGAVTAPGEFSLLSDMRVKDLILQAGGLSEDASLERGEIYRRIFETDTVRTRKIPFCVECAMRDDEAHNLMLKKQDRVFIRKKRGWQDIRRVSLLGEFVFPGDYVLLEGETLDQLIMRAGGFTDDAYLSSAVFTRLSVKKMERDRNSQYVRQLKSDMARLSMEMASKEKTAEAQYLLSQQMALLQRLEESEPVGRVVIDLNDPQSYKGFVLEDGDTLLVPKHIGTVSVMGQVFNPATMIYDARSNTVRQYIDLAGGLKDNADKKNIYVIRANGSVLSNDRRNINRYELNPGDVVVIPEKIRYTSAHRVFMDTIDAIYKIATTAGVVATLFAVSRTGNPGG
jgi:protein involved in polysaccharide export with SLBB domain